MSNEQMKKLNFLFQNHQNHFFLSHYIEMNKE